MDRFPHHGFCEEQFLSLMQTGTAVNVDALAKGLLPEVWGIKPVRGDVIELSQAAMLFSGRLGKGKVMVCTLDVLGNLNDKHPEAFYLLQALLDHVVSEGFQPKAELKQWNKGRSLAREDGVAVRRRLSEDVIATSEQREKEAKAGDAYARRSADGLTWTVGTKLVQMTFDCSNDGFRLVSFLNKQFDPAIEYVDPKVAGSALSSGFGEPRKRFCRVRGG